MNNKLKNYLNQIVDFNQEEQQRKRYIFMKNYIDRVIYCNKLASEGLTGKEYSDKMVQYDKQWIGG